MALGGLRRFSASEVVHFPCNKRLCTLTAAGGLACISGKQFTFAVYS